MAISSVQLAIVFVVILVSFIRQYFIRKQHPPGPLGFPFVGQLPSQIIQMIFFRFLPESSPLEDFKEMKRKYGDIWSVDLGNKRIITLASVDVINESLVDNAQLFSGRPIHESFKILSEDRGIGYADGKLVKTNREFAIKSLRNLGMGKPILIDKISAEADTLIENIEKNLSKPLMSPVVFVKAVSNVISLLSFDERKKYDDPEVVRFIENLNGVMHSNASHEIFEVFGNILDKKYLRKLFPVVDKYIKDNEACMEFISNKCRARMEIEGEFSKPNCVFDYFLRYRYQDNPNVNAKEKSLNINHSMLDLYIAGFDTSTNLLGFSCLILGQYPHIQKELKTEIESIVDDHKFINMEMKKYCPKLLSFIDEMQRYSFLVPRIQRRVVKPCTFKGYKIGVNDIVYADQATVMRDPAVFENPDDFNLYRFMDESKTKYIPNKSIFPFGMGKRVCLGESIAVMELFLFLSKIIRRFTISLPNETKIRLPKIFKGTFGILHAPLEHQIIFELNHK